MIFIVLIFKAMASSQIHKGVVTTVAESIRLPAAVLYSKRHSKAVQRGARVNGGATERKGAAKLRRAARHCPHRTATGRNGALPAFYSGNKLQSV